MTTPTPIRWPLSPAEECALQLLTERAQALDAEKRTLTTKYVRLAARAAEAKGLPKDPPPDFDLDAREWVSMPKDGPQSAPSAPGGPTIGPP